MFRRLVLVLSVMALTLVSCGRQITPDRSTSPTGLQPGYMEIKFNTYQPMDFVNVWYIIALNTDGTGVQPYPFNGNQQRNWLGYSFELVVFALAGQTAPQVSLIQFVTTPAVGGGTIKYPTQALTVNPQQLQLYPNCNGSQTQFCVIIDRHVFSGLGVGSATPTPSPSASATPSPSASPTPTPAPPAIGGIWNINWFTVSPSGGPSATGTVIAAPGPLGVNDTTWLPPSKTYDTTTNFDLIWNAVPPPGWPQVTPTAAQIAGGEVLNVP
jgi:hypothetical protein